MAAPNADWSTSLFVPRVLWAAMLVSTFIYGGLIVSGALPRDPDPSLRWLFPGLALAGAVASLVAPVWMRRAAPPLEAESREEVDPQGRSMFRDAAPTRRVAVDPAGARSAYLARRQAPFILGLALSEIPAIMGLLCWMVGDVPLASCLVLVALGAVLILFRFPSVNRWRADAEARAGALIPD